MRFAVSFKLPVRSATAQSNVRTIHVWDLPLRLFHWLLLGLLVAAWVTASIGGEAMDYHLLAGYGIVVLLVFRLLWGLVGSTYARFSSFVRGVPSAVAYGKQLLRGEAPHRPGHNPLGGWMIVAMLVLLAIQTGTGLFANDDILTEGPLFGLVSKATSDMLSAVHKLNFKLLLAATGLHILAVGFYLIVKRVNLIRPMITGRMICRTPCAKCVAAGACNASNMNARALALFMMVSAAVYLLLM